MADDAPSDPAMSTPLTPGCSPTIRKEATVTPEQDGIGISSTEDCKPRQRSPSVVKISELETMPEASSAATSKGSEPLSPPPERPAKHVTIESVPDVASTANDKEAPKTADAAPRRKLTVQTALERASGPGANNTPRAQARPGHKARANSQSSKSSAKKLHALEYLDQTSPDVSPELTHRTPSRRPYSSPTLFRVVQSPSAQSTSTVSSGYRDDLFDTVSNHGTERSISPSYAHNSMYGSPSTPARGPFRGPMGPPPPRTQGQANPMPDQFPIMAHSPASPFDGFGFQPEPLPFNEPSWPGLTGYNLLSSRLAARFPDENGPAIQPIYRRFEALNHRILLHIQDEICQLESQLQRLDDADTHNRQMLPGPVVPESRRAGEMAGEELYRQRNEVLGQIGFRLERYNNVLKLFHATKAIPRPTHNDLQEYRAFLNIQAPIAEVETHFLSNFDDLLCLNHHRDGAEEEDSAATPMQQYHGFPPNLHIHNHHLNRRKGPGTGAASVMGSEINSSTANLGSQEGHPSRKLMAAMGAMSASIFVPLVAFLAVPGFVGRLVVSLLIGGGVLAALLNSRYTDMPSATELMMIVGFYGSVMAFLAGIVA